MADNSNNERLTRSGVSVSGAPPRGRRPRGGDHYEPGTSSRCSSRAPRGGTHGGGRAAPGGHGVRGGRIEKPRDRGRGKPPMHHPPRTRRTPRDATSSPATGGLASGTGSGEREASGGPTSSPAPHGEVVAGKARDTIRRIKKDLEMYAEAPIYFCRPTDKLWWFLSPVNNEGVFELDGWQYNTVDMYLNACKAKAVGRDDLWKRVLQSGIVGGLKRKDGEAEIDVVKGFDVKLDGEREQREIDWADGKCCSVCR
jgi:hypothetical protein